LLVRFFFQAEDGIRDLIVTGVQTCALPISVALALVAVVGLIILRRTEGDDILVALGKGIAPRPRPIQRAGVRRLATIAGWALARSEERRVGKECRARGWWTR